MRTSRPALALVTASILFIPAVALACMWDYDTLKMERVRFPTALELITGKFLRHSREFYEWRINDRVQKLKKDPENLAYYDDLAVAYDKIGQHDKAIETIVRKDKKQPGLYATEANLGTFYIHAGQLEEGLRHIDRAIQINPDAHFGREKYQKALVEYVLKRRKAGWKQLPLAEVHGTVEKAAGGSTVHDYYAADGFEIFLGRDPLEDSESRLQAAVKGILGMMKFGNYDSPILLEALGNLLNRGDGKNPGDDAKRLAARAYLKASYEVRDESARQNYRMMARHVLQLQTIHPATQDPLPLEQLETDFQQELSDAQEWYAQLRQNELTWIRESKNPEQEFDRLYQEEPTVASVPELEPWFFSTTRGRFAIASSAAVLALLAVASLIVLVLVKSIRALRSRESNHRWHGWHG